ncbi:hypothetical protein NBRC116494_18240 [Aurantivibrio plasticivorans]
MQQFAILIRQSDNANKALESLDVLITACLFDCSVKVIFFKESLSLLNTAPYKEKISQLQDLGDTSFFSVGDKIPHVAPTNEFLQISNISDSSFQSIIQAADRVISL